MKKNYLKIGIFIAVGLVVASYGFFLYLAQGLPDVNAISTSVIGESTKIYDRTGTVLLADINVNNNRTIIGSSDMPQEMKDATVAIEDQSFYTNPAFDLEGTIRALITDVIRGQAVEGGSTITQQLARNIFLTRKKDILRKLKELILALRLARRYSKDQILTMYLNYVPYGPNIYGVEMAAQDYFGVNAQDLTLNETATLAAMPQAPSYYSPWGPNLSELQARKNIVLQKMLTLGYITQAQFNAAGTNLPSFLPPQRSGKAPNFVNYVEDYLTRQYGANALEVGGLKVITTLDWNLQQAAETAVKNGVARNATLYNGNNGALVAEDPKTGQILAMVGSKNYYATSTPAGCVSGKTCTFEGQFNVATQGLRQPGSSLKPFIYMDLLEQGFTPNTIFWDVPTEFTTGNPSCPPAVNFNITNLQCYHPVDFEGYFSGPMTLAYALANSVNVPAVKSLYLLGIQNAIKTLDSFGIRTMDNQPDLGLSLVLGGGEVRLLDMVNAYAALADDGVYHSPTAILQVTDSQGNVLEQYNDNGTQIVDPNYPKLINSILSNVQLREPLFAASINETTVPGYDVALKTGTTNDYSDAWAFGYAPNLVAGVWAGNNNHQPMQAQGSSILAAVPMWHDFMAKALPYFPMEAFSAPTPVSSSNPVLNGEMVSGQFHNILYYLGRTNDPEFTNWETGVTDWVATHGVDLSKFKVVPPSALDNSNVAPPPAGTSTASNIQISISAPQNGSFVAVPLAVDTRIVSALPITKVEVYLNNVLVDSKYGNFGQNYDYSSQLNGITLDPQNTLVVRATDEGGNFVSQQAIIYSNQ
ncbi:MAG: transglycosylase domain-containing protein [Patescibacteria group bacterium]|nr:transglycosylase domain-containing protein [Patescibacteria group bacterium]